MCVSVTVNVTVNVTAFWLRVVVCFPAPLHSSLLF